MNSTLAPTLTTRQVIDRINEIKKVMDFELKNNFPNGNLWNELSDKADALRKHGQENYPDDLKDENGLVIGYVLNDGTEYRYNGLIYKNS